MFVYGKRKNLYSNITVTGQVPEHNVNNKDKVDTLADIKKSGIAKAKMGFTIDGGPISGQLKSQIDILKKGKEKENIRQAGITGQVGPALSSNTARDEVVNQAVGAGVRKMRSIKKNKIIDEAAIRMLGKRRKKGGASSNPHPDVRRGKGIIKL